MMQGIHHLVVGCPTKVAAVALSILEHRGCEDNSVWEPDGYCDREDSSQLTSVGLRDLWLRTDG